MNKTELIARMAELAGISKKDAEKALEALTSVVTDELSEGNKVQITGFGTFETSERAARTGRNPKTGEEIEIPAAVVPKFKAGKGLKQAVSGK